MSVNFEFKENYTFDDLVEIVKILRSPGGCPWDMEQNHKSIREDFLEETYEVLEAIDTDNKVLLEDIQLQGQTNNVTTYKALAEVIGVLEELCCELKIPHEIIHSQTWKSGLGIKGRDRATQKRNAQLYVTETYGKKVSQDESDSICIGTHYIKSNKSAF